MPRSARCSARRSPAAELLIAETPLAIHDGHTARVSGDGPRRRHRPGSRRPSSHARDNGGRRAPATARDRRSRHCILARPRVCPRDRPRVPSGRRWPRTCAATWICSSASAPTTGGRVAGDRSGPRDHGAGGQAGARAQASPRADAGESPGHPVSRPHQSPREPRATGPGPERRPRRDAPHLPPRHGATDSSACGERADRSRRSCSPAARWTSARCPRSSITRATPACSSPSAISFAKDPTAETWNCAYNRLMLKGRDTTSIHLTLGKHLWEFHRIAESRGEPLPVAFAIGVHPAIALGALAIGSVDEDERAHHGRPAGRAAGAGPGRDLGRAGAGARRAGHRGRDPAPPAHGRGPLRGVHGLQPGRAAARGREGQGHHPPARRDLPGHRGGAPGPSAAVHHPHRGQPLPGRAGHGPHRASGPGARAVHVLRGHRATDSGPGQERHPGRAGRRPLHEARGHRGPRRRCLRRPAGELGDRHSLPAGPRPDGRSRTSAAPTSTPPPARTATPPSGASMPRPSPRSAPTRHATGWRRRRTTGSTSSASCRSAVGENFARLFEAAAQRWPDACALVWEGGRVSYRRLDRQANAAAAFLARHGVVPGERVALAIANRWPFAPALLGAPQAGGHGGAAGSPVEPRRASARSWTISHPG